MPQSYPNSANALVFILRINMCVAVVDEVGGEAEKIHHS